jgi:acetyltransferase-like isoleucine patch superfamily enzyme
MFRGEAHAGDRLGIRSSTARVEISVASDGELRLGDDVQIDHGASIGVTSRITIGHGCRIGAHVQIMDNNFHHLQLHLRDEIPPSRDVTIGDNVWIGPMAIVLPGTTIGAGSVVGPRSVVSSSVPPRSFATGLPATVVRHL